MPLDQSKLETDLTLWLANKELYATPLDSANVFAQAYISYAKDAIDFTGDQILDTPGEDNVASTLAGNLGLPGIAITAANGFTSAIQAFWTGATFTTGIPPATMSAETSSVVSVIPTGLSTAILAATFLALNTSATDASKATEIAAALHSDTLTVMVTITGTSNVFPFPTIQATGGIS